MSVSQLRSQPRVVGLLEAAQEAVIEAGGVAVGTVGMEEIADVIAMAGALESQAAALRLAFSVEADSRRAADDPDVGDGASGTDAWLAGLLGTTRAQQAAGLRLAGLLKSKYPAVREAYAAGRVRADQVRVIVNAAEQAPERATADQLEDAVELMVAKATGEATRSGRPMNAKRLRQAARRMLALIDPDLADEHEHAMLTRERHGADAETFLALHDNGDGTWTGRFRVPELHGNLLDTVLGHLTSPRRLSRDIHGHQVIDETAGGNLHHYETYGLALCELIEHLPTTGHAASQATILITLDLEALVTGIGAAGLDTGVTICAGDARRMACGAGLVPVVLGGKSEPLDVGRERRLHTLAQRRALAVIHDSCAITGCERPFTWCEIHHHKLAWGRGGGTSLDNGLPLCSHHHHKAHDPDWDLRQHTSGDYRFHRRR